MEIGIVGAGWYGCHLGTILKQRGHVVTVYEAGEDVLQRASSLNQARLHAGYHYPRCYTTRSQTIRCFERFKRAYPNFTTQIDNNVYGVSRDNSLMDFETYILIMRALGLTFLEVEPSWYGLENVEGAIKTEEVGLNFGVARDYFRRMLGSSLHLCHPVSKITDNGVKPTIDGKAFELVINCTWCALNTYKGDQELFFEPTTLLYYEASEPFFGAITTMDGSCFSVYPYRDNIYTLSHVGITPRGQFSSFAEADQVNASLNSLDIKDIRNRMVAEVEREFPTFTERFRFSDVQRSVKTKYKNAHASRSTIVNRDGNIMTILSGKIDTIFLAEDIILAEVAEREGVYSNYVTPLGFAQAKT